MALAPKARTEALQITEAGNELVIYDLTRFKAHRLNPTAATIWRACDGTRSVTDLAAMVSAQSQTEVGEEVVGYALKRLQTAKLLDGPAIDVGAMLSRRDVMALEGATAVIMLPVVASIVVPTPAEAQSGGPQGSSSGSSGGGFD